MLRATRQGTSQQGFVSAAHLPYLLLALAVLALLFLWNSIRSRDQQITELQQSQATEIAKLEEKIQSDGAAMAELNEKHLALQADHTTLTTERIPALQREMSFARAANQRASHMSDARDNLMAQLKNTKDTNTKLVQELQVLPELKRELSFANAENQRTQHVIAARNNLMAELQNTKDANTKTAMQLQKPDTQQTNAETDKLLNEIQILNGANRYLADRLLVVPEMKRKLSFARAENQRSQHVKTARDNLIATAQEAKQENARLSHLVTQIPDLKRELSYANAQNARLQHVSRARNKLIAEVQQLQNAGTN